MVANGNLATVTIECVCVTSELSVNLSKQIFILTLSLVIACDQYESIKAVLQNHNPPKTEKQSSVVFILNCVQFPDNEQKRSQLHFYSQWFIFLEDVCEIENTN